MITNFLKFVFHVLFLFVSNPGTDSFFVTNKKIQLSPIYRTNKNNFTLFSTPDILNTVSELVALKFDKQKEDIDPDSDFFKEFGGDKLDEVELLISLEDEFDLSIPNSQFKTLKTVKDISKYIANKLQLKEDSKGPFKI